MNLPRVMILVGIVSVAASAVSVTANLVRDPFQANRESLEQRLEEIDPAPEDTSPAFDPDADKWMKTIAGRPALWDSLTPKAVAAAKPVNVAAAMSGIRILPGSSGDRVRLATPDQPRGRMFQAGDSVKPNVVILQVDKDSVVFQITEGSQTVQHRINRR